MNLQISDLLLHFYCTCMIGEARQAALQNRVGERDEEEEEDLSLAYAARGQRHALFIWSSSVLGKHS